MAEIVTEGQLKRYALYIGRSMKEWETLRGDFAGLSASAIEEKMDAARNKYNKAYPVPTGAVSGAQNQLRPGIKEPTEKQLAVLYKYGIANGEKMTRSSASKIIGMLFEKNDDVWSLVELRDGRRPAF